MEQKEHHFPWRKSLVLLAVLLALAAAWRWTPLGDWLSIENLAQLGTSLRNSPWGPLAVLGMFILGSLLVFPVTVMIVVTALIFGPIWGFGYALAGTLLGAALTYAIGSRLGRNTVRNLAGSRVNRLSRRFAERGIIAMAVLRLLPIAPFTVVNMAAGASHLRFRDFMLGTLLGMGPGTLALTVFSDSILHVVRDPHLGNFAWLIGVVVVIGAGYWAVRRWLRKRNGAVATPSKA